MGVVYATSKRSGKTYSVSIAGDNPTAAEQAEINSYIDQVEGVATTQAPLVDSESGGGNLIDFGQGFASGFGRGFADIPGGLASLLAAGLSYVPGDQGEEEIEAFGQGITDAARSGIDYLIGTPDNSVASKSGQALGSLGSFLVPFAGGAKAASLLGGSARAMRTTGTVSAGTMGVALGAQNQVDRIARVLEEGGEVDSRELAVLMGGGIGATEALPVGKVFGAVANILKKVPKDVKEEAAKTIGKRLKSAGVAGLQEGGQEVVAAVLQDLVEKNLYNPDLELSASAYQDDAIYGGGAGATFNFLLESIAGRRVKKVIKARDQLRADQAEEGQEINDQVQRAKASTAGPEAAETPLLEAPRLQLTGPKTEPEVEAETDQTTAEYMQNLKDLRDQDQVRNADEERTAQLNLQREISTGYNEIDLSTLPKDVAFMISQSRIRSNSDIDAGAPTTIAELEAILPEGENKKQVIQTEKNKQKPGMEPAYVSPEQRAEQVAKKEADKKVTDNLSTAKVAVETGRATNKDGTVSRPKLQRELKVNAVEAQAIIDKLARQGVIEPIKRDNRDNLVYVAVQPEKTMEEAVPTPEEQRLEKLEKDLTDFRAERERQRADLDRMKQTPPTTQQEQIELERQESVVRDLDGRVNQLEQGVKGAQAAIAPAPKPTVQVRANAARSAVSEADQAMPTDEHKRNLNTIANRLRRYLAGLGLSDVSLTTSNVLDFGEGTATEGAFIVEGQEEAGVHGKRIITLAMEIYDPTLPDAVLEQRLAGVLNHEIIHSMKALGLFTDAEYKSLVKAAESRKYVKRTGGRKEQREYTFLDRAEHMYPELDPEGQQEEAVAEMFRAYADGRLKMAGKPKSLFGRMVQFIKRIFGAYNDAGFKDVDAIFEGITSGQIGRRQRSAQRNTSATKVDLLQDTDTKYSRRAVIPDDEFLSTAQFQNMKGANSTDQKKIASKLFKNREEPAGTMVTVRPNLNGFVTLPDGSKSVTQTMHPGKTYGTAVGYDSVMALTNSELRVSPQKRADIYRGVTTTGKKQDKVPMAGGYGAYAPIERARIDSIIEGAESGLDGYHTLSFNPGSEARGVVGHHLFVDGDGFAVKAVEGTAVHLGTKVYVEGDLEYWMEDEAPKPVDDLPTSVQFKPVEAQDSDRVRVEEADEVPTPKLSKRTLAINVPNVDSRDVDRISQRLPLGATATEDGVAENLRLTLDDLLSNERLTAKAAELIRNYNIITEQEAETLTDEQIIEVLTDRLADNLVFVYDSVDPQTRERSKLWYVGANRIANEIAQKYGVPVSSVAGVMAALSPQKDWYQNVSLAERLIDIKTTKMDMVPTKEMLATANRIFGKAQYQPMLNVIFRQGRNMPLSEYADAPLLEAMFIRIYDETYNDRGYNIVSPDGEDLGFSRKKDGTKSNVAWGSNVEISKAVRALDDPESVALEMGERHKVRNFYNNIVAPNSLDGDVTSDTHAVAAAHLKPLSGKSTEVHHNFGTAPTKAQQEKLPDWRGAMSNSKPTGVMGTYVIYAEAHRRAAERRGTLPREMQSITWEAVRGLFLPSFKANANNVQKIDDIWNNYRKGLIDIDQVRQEVMNEAGDQGRFRPPSWEGPDSGSLKSAELAIDENELSGAIVSRRTPRDYGRVGGEPARGNPRDIDEPNFGNLSEKQIDDLAETRDVFESLPKYSRRSAPAPAILGAPDQEARARTGLPIINRFSTVSAPVRFPDKRFNRYESLFGVIMDGNKPVPVLLFAGEHNNETNGGFGLSHILERNHEIELKENSKFPDIETAIQQTFFAWAKQGHQDGPRVVSSVGTAGGDKARSVDGVFRSMSKKDLVLDWVDPSHKSKAPFRIVLNYGIVSDPDVKAEFGFKNDIPVYSITTAYPVLALKDRANVRQSKRSVTVMPIDYRPPSFRPITAMVEENEEAYQRITYNNVAKVLGNISRKFASDERADRIQARSERFLTKFQDAMLPIGKMMDELRSDGYSVADGLDTYMREELSHGVIGYKLENNRRKLFDPLAQTINAIDVGQSDIDRLTGGNNPKSIFLADAIRQDGSQLGIANAYMYALHAKERNRFVQDRFGRGLGSGMSDAEADNIINWVQSLDADNQQALNGVRDYVKQIVASTNEARRDGGLMASEYDFDFYVPLRGNLDPDEEIAQDEANLARSYNMRRPDLYGGKRRQDPRITAGRGTSYAEDIIGTVMHQNQTSILNGERNKVGQSFLKLVQDEKVDTKDFAEVVTEVPDRNKDNVLGVKVNGQLDPVKVFIYDDRIARAMKGAYGEFSNRGGAVVRAMTQLNRYLSSINTTYNPEFLVTNFARDLETAIINVNQYSDIANMDGLAKDITKNVAGSIRGIIDHIRKTNRGEDFDRNNYWSNVYQEFIEKGGRNATNQIDTVEDQVRNIKDVLDSISTNTARGKLGLAKNSFVGKGARSLLQMLDDANTAVENGIRVATYDALIKRNFSEERAAQAARNVTVNFAKAGEDRAMMNAAYLFYNASVQGSFALYNAMIRSPKVRKLWGAMILFGVLQDQFLSALSSDEDEDGKKDYDEISDYTLEHNILLDTFGLTDDKYVKIPLGYGINSAVNLGRAISRVQRGEYSVGEASSSIFGTLLESISPIGGVNEFGEIGDYLVTVSPTVLEPGVALLTNRDYDGSPIYKEGSQFGLQKPSSQTHWTTTSDMSKSIATTLNDLTGGSDVTPGAANVSPDVIDYLFSYYTGAAGMFALRTAEAPSKVVDALKEDYEGDITREIPFVRKLFVNPSAFEDVGVFIENRDRVLYAGKELQFARQKGDRAREAQIREEYAAELSVYGQLKALNNARNQLMRQKSQVENNPRISDDQKEKIVKRYREKINEIVKKANAVLRDAGIK